MIELERLVLGRLLHVQALELDDSWDVGIYGGSSSHVGAVTLSDAQGRLQTIEQQGHRDSVVSKKWASILSESLGACVCVRCGIHYELSRHDELSRILAACDALLQTLLSTIQKKVER